LKLRAMTGSVANFSFWGKIRNLVSEIQWLTNPKTPQKANLRQNPLKLTKRIMVSPLKSKAGSARMLSIPNKVFRDRAGYTGRLEPSCAGGILLHEVFEDDEEHVL
jgi:hypothetical protein